MITCKLTGNVGKGIKAHIVPKAFYEIPPQKKGSCKLLSNEIDYFSTKSPIGIYDKTIVTKEGEALFGRTDCYAIDVLLKKIENFKIIRIDNEIIGLSLENYDYSLLKLFVLSVLWRAHITNHKYFSQIDLEKHEEPIRHMLLNGNPGDSEEYSVFIVRWIDIDNGLFPVFMDPRREKLEGINYNKIYCGRYLLYIKVDKRPTSQTYRAFQLFKNNKNLFLFTREFKNSQELPIMKEILEKNKY